MNARATIEGYMAAMQEAQEDERELVLREKLIRRDLERVISLRVGAHEKVIKAREALRVAQLQEVRYEVTCRDRDVAHAKGFPELKVGEELTFEFRSLLYG